MPYQWILVLVAVVAGWVVQLALAYRQSMAFTADARTLRGSGTVTVGVGGRRYRGGRAYVAMAVDDDGVVRDAISLRGFTTFARTKAAPQLVGLRVNRIAGERDVEGLTRPQREAARQAATFVRRGTPSEELRTQEVPG